MAAQQDAVRVTQRLVEVAVPLYALDSYIQAVMQDHPYSFLPCYDAVGATTLKDLVGGTASLQSTYTLGQSGPSAVGTGIALNGSTGYIFYTPSWNLGDTFTTEMWIKCASPTTVSQRLYDRQAGGDGQIFVSNATVSHWQVDAQSAGQICESTSTLDTNWHHIAWTKATTTTHLYQDGTDVSGTVTNVVLTGSTGQLVVGAKRDGTGVFFNGSLALIAFYPTALSSTRIAAHFTAAHTTAGGIVSQDVIEAAVADSNARAHVSQDVIETAMANSSARAHVAQDVIEVAVPKFSNN